MFRILGVVVLAISLCACVSRMSGEYAKGSGKTLVLTKDVWSGFQTYSSKVGVGQDGGFVVAVRNGVGISYSYVVCPDSHCMGAGNEVTQAMASCEDAKAFDCILFAESSEILVDYKVMD
jgi:hypothetical protein